jgi:hemolysin III
MTASTLFSPGRFECYGVVAYLSIGWSAAPAIKPLIAALPIETLALVVAGGGLYSVGVVFHLWPVSNFRTRSGMHA